MRRPRYSGRNPRAFHEKYKELDPARYPEEVRKVLESGKTPAGMHVPIMVDEVLAHARPGPGDVAVDCTLGGGGHARALLARLQPGGRLIGLDVDPLELPQTEGRLRSEGFGADVFTTRHTNFAGLPQALAAEGVLTADVVIADLGVSSMQIDNPLRGFSYKTPGPLDMRMNPTRGEPAASLLERLTEAALAALLEENDEPHAESIASVLKQQPLTTTDELEEVVRAAVTRDRPRATEDDIKLTLRRTFQALRTAVNDEFRVLDALLRVLPHCLAPGGRAVIITFHSGEDRRVKRAFQSGHRDGIYADVNSEVIRPSPQEIRANRRASAAKLRWAVRADDREQQAD